MDYVKYPDWYDDEQNNYSETLKDFLDSVEKYEKKFDLEYLRDIYKKNTEKFNIIVDELALRGFEFYSVRQNNLLPKKITSINSPRLKVDENFGYYNNINFTKLYLGNFKARFGVVSDSFFHNIPLSGFMHLNAALSMDEIAVVFEKAGFLVLNRNNLIDDLVKEETMIKYEDTATNSIEIDYNLISIESIGLSKRAKNGLFRSGIRTVSELLKLNVDDLYRVKNLGEKSIDEIVQIMNDIDTIIISNIDYVSIPLDESNNLELPREEQRDEAQGVDALGLTTRAINALKRERIFTVSQFLNLSTDEIREIKNVGAMTLDQLISIQRKLKSQRDVIEAGSSIISIPQRILDTFGEVCISKISTSFEDTILKIKDFNGAEFKEVFADYDTMFGIRILDKIHSLRTFEEILKGIKISEIEEKVLVLRYQQGNTLEEVGKVMNVTRERIRQRQSKAERQILLKLSGSEFIYNLRLLSPSEYSCSKKLVLEALNYNKIYFQVLIKSSDVPLTYIPWTEHFIFEKDTKLDDTMLKIFQDQDDQFNLLDIIDPVIDVFNYYGIRDIELSHIENMIKDYGMNIYGEIVSKVPLSSEVIALIMLQSFYPKGLRLDDNSYDSFTKLAKKYYDYDKMPASFRTVENIFRYSYDVFLIDKLTFVHASNVEYEENIIEEIDTYIEKKFNKVESVRIEEIMERFNGSIEDTILCNKRLLYSILKNKFGEKYFFGHKNTLQIYRNNLSEQISLRDQLTDYLKKNNNIALRIDINQHFNWTESRLSNCTTNYKEFLNTGTGSVRLLEKLEIDEDEYKIVRDHIANICKEGFFSIEVLYTNLIFDVRISSFIASNFIQNSTVLGQIIKMLFPQYKGGTLLFFETSSQYRSIEDIIKDKFHRAYRSELIEFTVSLMYKDLVVMKMTNELVEKKVYVEISEDELLRADLLDINEEAIDSVMRFIEEKISDEDYLPLRSVHGYKRLLPKINYDWNPYLIRSISMIGGFKELKYKRRDPRNDQLIILREDSKLETLEDLCISVLKKEYNDNLHESKVYSFLESKGILPTKNNTFKELPYEIKNGRNISVDEVGKVVLEE